MSKLREAAQAAPDAKVRAQHKEFARWFLELSDKSALASEYLAWLAWKAALAHPPRDEWREAAEEALRWMEHARLHLTIKERMHPDGLSLYDSAAEALRAALAQPETETEAEAEPVAWRVRWIDPEEGPGDWVPTRDPDFYRSRPTYEVRPLYAHPPRDEWREAVHDELVTTWTLSAENKDDPRKALQDIINWHVRVSLDPDVSSDACALIERGKAMRDEWRPASEPPEDSLPHAYLLKKLAMVMPLFEEARDALTAISEQQRAVRCISPTLADRMDMAGTYSIDDWRDVTPPTEGE